MQLSFNGAVIHNSPIFIQHPSKSNKSHHAWGRVTITSLKCCRFSNSVGGLNAPAAWLRIFKLSAVPTTTVLDSREETYETHNQASLPNHYMTKNQIPCRVPATNNNHLLEGWWTGSLFAPLEHVRVKCSVGKHATHSTNPDRKLQAGQTACP